MNKEKEILARLEDMRNQQIALIERYGRWRAFWMFWFEVGFKEREAAPSSAPAKEIAL